jgi:hypothetical protein
MPIPYLQNKIHIYNWREKNREEYNEKQKKYKLKYENWKRIQKIYFQILL